MRTRAPGLVTSLRLSKKKKAGGNAGFCDGALHIPANNAAIQADLACGGGAVAGRMTEEEKKQKIAAAAARARAARDSALEQKKQGKKEQDPQLDEGEMRATATAATQKTTATAATQNTTATAATQNTTATAATEATQEEKGETKANASYICTYIACICIYVRLQQLQQKCVTQEEGETSSDVFFPSLYAYNAYICTYVRLQQLQQKCVRLATAALQQKTKQEEGATPPNGVF